MLGVGWSEMLILGVIGLLLFGKRLPEVARNLGKGMMEFKKGMYDIQDDVTSAANRAVSYCGSSVSALALPSEWAE